MSATTQEANAPSMQQPTCWTMWIKDNKHRLIEILSSGPNKHKLLLKMRDSRFRYTIVHALMAGDICDKEMIHQLFNILRKNSLISLITAKDKEGDTPLHSAIRSGTQPELIKLLMNAVPGMKTRRRLLMERNKCCELPIVSAFNLRRWSIVEVLLEECVRCQVLPELIGIGIDLSSKQSNTLLLKAMKRGFIRYLKIYLSVSKRCTNSIPLKAMLIPDKFGRTPWFRFLSLDVDLIEEGLSYLKEYDIDINKLLCDRNGRTSLLHEAFRRDNKDVCDLLIKFGANLEQLDANNLSPPQRKRIISLQDSQQGSPLHRGNVALRPTNLSRYMNWTTEKEPEMHQEQGVGNEEGRERNKRKKTKGDDRDDQIANDTTPGRLGDSGEPEPAEDIERDNERIHRPTPHSVCLEYSLSGVMSKCLSLSHAGRSSRTQLHFHGFSTPVCFLAHGDGRLILMKWYSPTPSFFTKLVHQPSEHEPEFCPIYDINSGSLGISSFNTLSPIP